MKNQDLHARVGMKIARVTGRRVLVLDVEPGGAAQRGGIQPRTEILAIDGDDVRNLSWEEIIFRRLRNPGLRQFSLTCRVPSSAQPIEVVMKI